MRLLWKRYGYIRLRLGRNTVPYQKAAWLSMDISFRLAYQSVRLHIVCIRTLVLFQSQTNGNPKDGWRGGTPKRNISQMALWARVTCKGGFGRLEKEAECVLAAISLLSVRVWDYFMFTYSTL
jgi:hypothetical protein